MLFVLAALAGLLVVLSLYKRLASPRPHPELLRKLLHVGMGLVTLSFPWLFDSAWPIIVLVVLSIGLLLSLRLVEQLRESVGQVVGGVQRSSPGEVYFPLGMALLWGLYLYGEGDRPDRRLLCYIIPALLLALSDALAALVGVWYGQLRYETPDGTKTHEGSLAFFFCSFLCVHVPLLLMTDVGRAETLLIAILLALMMTLFEAIAWSGLDNLVLPVLAYALLQLYWDKSVGELLVRLAVMGGVSVAVFALSWMTPMRGSAVAGAALVGYICWALGDWHWLVPPLVLYAGYVSLSCRNPVDKDYPHTIHAVSCTALVGLVWLFLSVSQERPDWFYPFAVAFAANLGMVALAQMRYDYVAQPVVVSLGLSAVGAWLAILGPFALMGMGVGAACFGLPAVALAVVAFYFLQPDMENCPVDAPRWLRQTSCAAVASGLAALVPLLLG
jgi:phytol kinase